MKKAIKYLRISPYALIEKRTIIYRQSVGGGMMQNAISGQLGHLEKNYKTH